MFQTRGTHFNPDQLHTISICIFKEPHISFCFRKIDRDPKDRNPRRLTKFPLSFLAPYVNGTVGSIFVLVLAALTGVELTLDTDAAIEMDRRD